MSDDNRLSYDVVRLNVTDPASLAELAAALRIREDDQGIPRVSRPRPRGEWRDAGHAGAGWRPRTSLPGRAAVGTPRSAMTSPDTTVAT